MIELLINNKKCVITKGLTLLQACETIGIQIPRFCYHEQLSIAGNCRMCLVEVDKANKPFAACAITAENGMSIYTNTNIIKKAREGVMEFLLINHPLDCPICDQGGECDLQDQSMLFGNDRGRFYEIKRAVSELDLGPFIKTVMTRCIHCTRCVRFLSELGGNVTLGTTGRGVKTEIGNYTVSMGNSEVSGNIIDLCPVGALTSKPYAFTARSWELTKIESIDILDSMCSNVSYHVYSGTIIRVLPILHLGINEEWLTNRTRFSYDSYILQRITVPLVNNNNNLVKSNWFTVFKKINLNIGKSNLLLLNNDLSLESVYAVRNLKNSFLNTNLMLQECYNKKNIDFRQNYLLNTTYTLINKSDLVFLVGLTLKKQLPLLLIRLRKEKRDRQLKIFIFGNSETYSLNEKSIGVTLNKFITLIEGKHLACSNLKQAQFPLFLLGSSVLLVYNNKLIENLYYYIPKLFYNTWNGLNFIENGAGNVGAYDLGVKTCYKNAAFSTIININNNLKSIAQKSLNINTTYMGSHGADSLKDYSNILPVKVGIEETSIFINNEGRGQLTKLVQIAPLKSKILWEILVLLFDKLFIINNTLNNKNNLENLRMKIANIYSINLNLTSYTTLFLSALHNKYMLKNQICFPYVLDEFHTTSVIKYSRILAKAKKITKKSNYN